jgi:hypothetical protein
MHPRERTQQLEQTIVELWSQYDLAYEFTVTSVTAEGDTATADVLRTTKLCGPAFQNNTRRERVRLVTQQEWYVADTEPSTPSFTTECSLERTDALTHPCRARAVRP